MPKQSVVQVSRPLMYWRCPQCSCSLKWETCWDGNGTEHSVTRCCGHIHVFRLYQDNPPPVTHYEIVDEYPYDVPPRISIGWLAIGIIAVPIAMLLYLLD
jgi:hypothetical protein